MAGDNERFDALSPRWLNIRKKIINVDISDDKAELTIIDGWCNAIKNMWKELEKNCAESDFRQGVIRAYPNRPKAQLASDTQHS